jgi:hypothetical protein
MIKVRFSLAPGEHYMHWQIRRGNDVTHVNPMDAQLVMYDARLVNHKSTAKKIHEGAHKEVCAWVSCKKVEVSTCNFSRLYPVEESAISYNPKRQPNWVDFNGDVIDGMTYKKVVSVKNHLYVY